MFLHALDINKNTITLQNDIKTLQIRIPDQLRHDADLVLADIGLDMPTAVRLYLAKIVQTRSIPFTLTASPAPPLEPAAPEVAVTQEQIDAVDANWEKRKKARASATTRKPRPP